MLKALLTGTITAAVVSAVAAAEVPMDGEVVLNSTIASLTDSVDSGSVAHVKPGDELTITGACVANAKSAGDLRVMLTVTDGHARSGLHVLATDQSIGADGLNVRVPDLPETANRDFNVKVFRLNQDGPEICNAGTIHVSPSDHLG
jgi:hypothetical protein